ncbi:helix-turn-helix domain-containing protein [Lyngbya confervoides]
MKNSDQAVIDIVLEGGFNSHSHWSKQFWQVTGLTPREFRRG